MDAYNTITTGDTVILNIPIRLQHWAKGHEQRKYKVLDKTSRFVLLNRIVEREHYIRVYMGEKSTIAKMIKEEQLGYNETMQRVDFNNYFLGVI